MGLYEKHVLPHVLNLAMRSPDLIPYRKRLLSLAEGRVLEIGLGSGLNLPFYPAQTTEILGLDPHPKLLAMARRKTLSIPTSNIEGSAELIPLDSRSIDTVVTTWTLCSIPHVSRALAEVRRVLKPGGQFLFVEHGLAPDDKVRRWQRRLTPVWKKISGGCHLDRPMETLVHDAGFHVASLSTGYMPGPKPMTFMYEGCAHPL
jgi:SAM-dependent methyltransferase